MKIGRTVALAAVAWVIHAAADRGFGPANCVSLSRSAAGSCVLHTKCAGQDLSNYEFSFDCVAQSGRETHSLGFGSFDVEEEYDTDLKCQECAPPAAKKAAPGLSLAAVSVSRELRGRAADEPKAKAEEKKEEKADEPAPKAEWYGPSECVGVWKDEKTSQCIMQTDCDKDAQINVYEFGLICVDEEQVMTRHIFGMDSFGHKETFDTLIKCEKCQALDEYMDGNKAIKQLTKMVKGMKDDLTAVSSGVVKLNAEVFPAGPSPGPAAAAPSPAAAQPVKFMLDGYNKNIRDGRAARESKITNAQASVASLKDLIGEDEAPQPQAPPAAKVELAHQLPEKDIVTHLKKKASQAANYEAESMQDILAAAVNGAGQRGLVMGNPKLQQAIAQRAQQGGVTQQAQQVAAQNLQKQQAVVQEVKVPHESKASDDDDADMDDEDDHSKDDDDDDE